MRAHRATPIWGASIPLSVLTLMLTLSFGLLAACHRGAENVDVSAMKVSEKVQDAFDDAREDTFQKRADYERTARQYLDAVDAQIAALQTRVDRSAEGKTRLMQDRIDALKDKRDRAARKVDELGSATADTWNEAKSSVRQSFDDLVNSLELTSQRLG